MAWQPGPRPDFAPGIAGNQFLKFGIEVGPVLDGAAHIRIAEDSPTQFQPFFIPIAFVHPASPVRKSVTARLKRALCSMFDKCALSSSRYRAPEIFCAMNRPSVVVVATSRLPLIMSAGSLIFSIWLRRSAARS